MCLIQWLALVVVCAAVTGVESLRLVVEVLINFSFILYWLWGPWKIINWKFLSPQIGFPYAKLHAAGFIFSLSLCCHAQKNLNLLFLLKTKSLQHLFCFAFLKKKQNLILFKFSLLFWYLKMRVLPLSVFLLLHLQPAFILLKKRCCLCYRKNKNGKSLKF